MGIGPRTATTSTASGSCARLTAGFRRLSKSLDSAVVVDNTGKRHDRVFFGATVSFQPESGDERAVTIVGLDELDAGSERISWQSPMAKALLKARVGDVVTLRTPGGVERLEVVDIRYDALP